MRITPGIPKAIAIEQAVNPEVSVAANISSLRLYGEKLRQVSGVSKTVRQALPSPVRDWQSAADDYLNSTVEYIEDFLDHARPKLAAGMENSLQGLPNAHNSPSPPTRSCRIRPEAVQVGC
jgi:hypothetical protein